MSRQGIYDRYESMCRYAAGFALLSILLAIAVSELLIRGVDPTDAIPNVRVRQGHTRVYPACERVLD